MGERKISEAAVKRIPVYLRVLNELDAEDVTIIASADLASETGYSSEQIRKDFAYFGAYGTRGVGYEVQALIRRLKQLLGLSRSLRVAIVGAGHLGTALARYNIKRQTGVRVSAIFDVDPERIGQTIAGVEVSPFADVQTIIGARDIRVAIIAVPPAATEEVGVRLMEAGIEAILNFSPVRLHLPDSKVHVQHIDLSIELQSLAYYTSLGDRANAETGVIDEVSASDAG